METVRFKKLSPSAIIPKRATAGSAGMDLFPTEVIRGTNFIQCRFGLSMHIPDGHAAFIFPRSSIKNFPYMLSNSVGIIDSDYRGEIMAFFNKVEPEGFPYPDEFYKEGQAVAQMVIMPIHDYLTIEVDELSETERGSGGFGSTNK